MDDLGKEVARRKILDTAHGLLGVPYLWGAKEGDITKRPQALDCSGLVSYCYKTAGLKIPDGSQEQYDATVPMKIKNPGDLGFFKNEQNEIYHIGIIFDSAYVIEARAFDASNSFPTGKVILRPVSAWEAWKHFAGWRALPELV